MAETPNVLTADIRACRARGVPLVSVSTADPANAERAALRALNGSAADACVVRWDSVAGAVGLTDAGWDWLADVCQSPDVTDRDAERRQAARDALRLPTGNAVEMLHLLRKLPATERPTPAPLAIVHGSDALFAEPGPVQALWNLRDPLKSTGATVVLLGNAPRVPPSLVQDVVTLDDPLPTPADLAAILASLASDAGVTLDADTTTRAVEALAGLSSFGAEQVAALAFNATGLDVARCWDRKRRQIAETPGLACYRGRETFADLRGLDNLAEYLSALVPGYGCVVFIDEIEKALGGSGTDTSGVSQGLLGSLLSFMTDEACAGVLLLGPPGTGKSAIAKAAGNSAGRPVIALDLGAVKDSLVGKSEANMRAALRVIRAVSDRRPLFLATCNSVAQLPPELRRRFSAGTFFVDLPGAAARSALWSLYLGKHGLPLDSARPDDAGWTGAEIENACTRAAELRIPVARASRYVTPVCVAAREKIDALRRDASGRYIAADHDGLYEYAPIGQDRATPATATPATGRRMEV
jgi:hypothetical protein